MKAYKVAWTKCLEHVRSILQALSASVVDEVAHEVIHAYSDVLPGLPYPELPVIALFGVNASILSDVVKRLDKPEEAATNEQDQLGDVHLYPAECGSIINMMRALVTGFVDQEGDKRKATSLAAFDVNLLVAWHAAQQPRPRLTAFLHEFERFDAEVVKDVMHVPHLPLVFVTVMTSPPTPSFLHTMYPRSSLALLRIREVVAPGGLAMINEVLSKTFFDVDFEPTLMLGPGSLDYIADFARRHSASPDALLAHMKHFAQPLTVFADEDVARQVEPLSSSPDFASTLGELHTRLLPPTAQDESTPLPRPETFNGLLERVSGAHAAFAQNARRVRVGFAVARLAERVALGETPQSSSRTAANGNRLGMLEALSDVLRGRVDSQVRYVCVAVKKLRLEKLRVLLGELHNFWNDIRSVELRNDEGDARIWLVGVNSRLPDNVDPAPNDPSTPPDFDAPMAPPDPETKALAAEVGEWLLEYIEDHLAHRLDERALWDVWYTGGAPFPSELINPAPRAATVAALLRPHDFVRAHTQLAQPGAVIAFGGAPGDDGDEGEKALWEVPDTSIAFRRYVEAGRMVNVFDWFESFALVLENQREHLRRRVRVADGDGKTSKGKGRAAAATDGEDEDEEVGEEAEEAWKVEVQARFVRALHELDYMGFVRHTGRKADHVIRTIYDVPD
ncbi:uncharacterized protein BXZ73DRAFT_58354 [Epithele typhae]|uniref:uncharacterized protein n=1 Tax=Epithele typhae TaxID=378194 RepID=UPI0020084C59|nr:uncharacterized protein BXZ73DRAFT_58354 [Epithele typhae]KAH9910496.1 hypothetical protein BXZ73DRAFT_58354 [Epithele typhae]